MTPERAARIIELLGQLLDVGRALLILTFAIFTIVLVAFVLHAREA